MSIMQWSYSLAIRAKNSAGTVLGTYFAGTLANGMVGTVMAIPKTIGPPTYEKVQLDREMYDYSHAPVIVGFRPHLTVAWEQRSPGIIGLASGSDLRTVLAFVTTIGDYLEVSLDGGSTWRSCNLESSSIDYKTIDGKAVGVSLELAFEGRKLVKTSIPDASAAAWGGAV
jgi:hypothetical protein